MSENNYEMSISRDDFSKLLNLLKTFENICTDCDVQNGMIRCKNNDRHAIIEMDLTSILQQNCLSFSLIKNKVALLKSFELDDNVQVEDRTIRIISNDSNYEFYDPFSRLVFRKPLRNYLDNQFITNEEFSSMITLSEDNLIFSHVISNYIKKRIANISINCQTDMIACEMIDNSALLKVSSSNGENSSIVVKDIPLNRTLTDLKFNLNSIAFMLDIASDLTFNCYKISSDRMMCKFEQTFYGVPINLYSQVRTSAIQ